MAENVINTFFAGTHNVLDPESIPHDAAQDSNGWLTLDGALVLSGGRDILGTEGVAGGINNEWFGYQTSGTKIHYRKAQAKIQYWNGTAWSDIITGLTASAIYTFSNYSAASGAFTYITGIDGIFKINNAFPATYQTLWNANLTTPNYNGYTLIDKARTFLWGNPHDPTGFYWSWVDLQTNQSGDWTTVNNESLGTGNGSNKVFTGTLAFKVANDTKDCFSVSMYSAVGALKTITAITAAARAQVTASSHGFSVGDKVIFQAVVGMVEINNQYGVVTTVIDANNFNVGIDTSTFTAYSSAGKVGLAELFTDDFNGNLTSSTGGVGSINYLTGVYSITFFTAPVNTSVVGASYTYQDSNVKNIMDFTHVVNNVGSGGVLRQDYGGDKIMQVVVGLNGDYYSFKQQSIYKTFYDSANALATDIYRRDMGVPSVRSAVSRGSGIVFMNTINLIKPELTILEQGQYSANLVPRVLFPQYRFQNYYYDTDTVVDFFERWYVVLCKSSSTQGANDIMLLCNVDANTVDKLPYGLSCIARDNSVPAVLYAGSPLESTTYMLNGTTDDLGNVIPNYWKSKAEWYDTLGPNFPSQHLKKFRKIRLQGNIAPSQYYEVYVSYDDGGYQLVGTIRGDGPYVDNSGTSQTVGGPIVGTSAEGGDSQPTIFPYYTAIKVRTPKFFKRAIMFVAKGFGYASVSKVLDWDVLPFENRLPARFRQQENVSLDGTQNNIPQSQI